MVSTISTTCFQPASGGELEKFQLITTSQPFSTGVQLCTTLTPPGLAASFHSTAENNLAFNMYINAFPLSQTEINSLSQGASSPFFENGVFFGLRDPVGTAPAGDLTTTRFSYVDGTTYDFGSTGHQSPWDSAEPNNFQGQAENCIEYNRETGLWNDINCSVNRRMFCRTKCNAPTPSPTNKVTSSPTKAPTKKVTSSPTKAPTKKITSSPSKAPTQKPIISTNAPTPRPIISTTAPTSQIFGIPTPAPTQVVTFQDLSRSNRGQLSGLMIALILVGAIVPIAVIILLAILKRRQINKRKVNNQNDSHDNLGDDDLVFGFWKSKKKNPKDIEFDIVFDEVDAKKGFPSGLRPESIDTPIFSINSFNTMRPPIGSFDASAPDNSSSLDPGAQFNKQFSNARSPLFREDPSQFSLGAHVSVQSKQVPRYKVSNSVAATRSPLFREDPSQFAKGFHASVQSQQVPRYKVSNSVSTVPVAPSPRQRVDTSDL